MLGTFASPTQVKFARVKNRTSGLLHSVINKFVKEGSLIWIDELKSYDCLSQLGFVHETVNHSVNYVDAVTGAQTQVVKKAWLDGKSWYRHSRGNLTLRQSHLDENSWRKLRNLEKNEGTLFKILLPDT